MSTSKRSFLKSLAVGILGAPTIKEAVSKNAPPFPGANNKTPAFPLSPMSSGTWIETRIFTGACNCSGYYYYEKTK